MNRVMLKEYLRLDMELRQIETQISELESKYASVQSLVIGVAPKGGTRMDFTDLIAKLHDLRIVYYKKWDRLIDLKMEIERSIAELGGAERILMRARYLEGASWEKVAEALNFSEQHVMRLHKAIMAKLEREVRKERRTERAAQ